MAQAVALKSHVVLSSGSPLNFRNPELLLGDISANLPDFADLRLQGTHKSNL